MVAEVIKLQNVATLACYPSVAPTNVGLLFNYSSRRTDSAFGAVQCRTV